MKRSKVLPGRMADTGMIRWPMNFPPSSNTAILSEASVGKTTCNILRDIFHEKINKISYQLGVASVCYEELRPF